MAVAAERDDQGASILAKTLRKLYGSRPPAVHNAIEVHELIEKGLPSDHVISFINSVEYYKNFKTDMVLKVIGMSERTLHRRIKQPQPLTAEQSSRAWRFAETLSKAEEVFGERQEAERWLVTPALGLNGRAPIDLLTTQVGYGLVDDYLTRIDHGVYS